MKKVLTTTGIFTGVFALSFGVAFFSQYKDQKKIASNVVGETVEQPKVITDQQRVLNSLLDIQGFSVEGGMEMIAKDNTSIGFTFNGKGDLTDLENIKLSGDIDVLLNESHLRANFGYFEDELFFDYHNSYFKLETSKLFDFIKLLPTNYNVGLELPAEIEDIDLSLIESYFDDMSDKQLTPDGNNYYFTINLSDKVPLFIITDLDLNFAGLRSGTIDYNGMIFKLNVSLTRLDTVNLVSPKESGDYAKYQDFEPAFKLFDGIYALTQKKQNTINADIQVRKNIEGEEPKSLLKTNLDVTYDLESENHLFGLAGKIISSKNDGNNVVDVEVPYSFAIYNENLYAHYGDIAIQIETDSVTELLQFILNKIGDEKISELFSSMTSTMSTSQITDIIAKANDLLGTIVLTEDELGINLNTSNFSTTTIDEITGEETSKLELSNLYVAIKFNSNTGALESISIKNFGLNDYEADVVLTFGDYHEFKLDNLNYQKIDHLLGIATIYDKYSAYNQFRIEFNGKISKEDEIIEGKTVSYEDININGGLQFELDPLREEEGHVNVGYGYGDLSITDRNNTEHKVKVDMKNVNEVLVSYRTVTGNATRDANVDPMNVKMKVQTIKDLVEIVSEVVKNPDDHLEEIMGSLLDTTTTMPIQEIIAGDYLQLLTTNLIDRFEVGQDYVEFDIALDVLAMEGTSFTVRIDFTSRAEGVDGLKDIKISNLNFKGLCIEFNAYLKDFDESLESSRLSPAEEYIDFSDLKVLLQLGINTSKNNYYHFNATAKVTITLFSISLDLPLDIKVWTDHGDVKVSLDITDIPVILGINVPTSRALTTSDRTAHLYYHDKVFYVQRSESYTSGILWMKETHKVEHIAKYDLDGFMNNVLDILCGDVLCLNDTFMDKINDAVNKNKDDSYKMKYENILNDFLYSKSGHYFYFDINLAEIANNDQLESFTLKVLTDDSDTNLNGLNAKLTIKLTSVLSLVLSIDLQLADCSLVADATNNLVALDNFENRMSQYAIGYRTTTDTTI